MEDRININGVTYIKENGVEILITKELVANFLTGCDYYTYIWCIHQATEKRLNKNNYLSVEEIIEGSDSDADRAMNMLMIYKGTE